MKNVQVERRRQRAREEGFRVENLGDDPIYASFRVQGASERTYTVTIRDLSAPGANGCTCPDFLVNQLGTCKHIEAVILDLQQHQRSALRRARLTPPPVAYVYLNYGEAISVEARRPLQPSPRVARLIDAHFDFQGRFRGDPVAHFGEFEEDLARLTEAERAHLQIAEDVGAWLSYQRAQRKRSLDHSRYARAVETGRIPYAPLQEPLYPFQVRGALFLAFQRRALLADEMGLGKTVEALAAFQTLRQREGFKRALVICPASLKRQWEREVARFLGEAATVLEGPRRDEVYRQTQGAVLIASYEICLRDKDALQALAPDLVILDEAQRIKNWRTRTAQAVKELPSKAAFVLTGAPLESDLEALYSIVQFLDQRAIGPLWRYMERYYRFDGRGRHIGFKDLDELKQRIAPLYLRRTREQVQAELPDLIESSYAVALPEPARLAYDAARQKALGLLELASCAQLDADQRRALDEALAAMRHACIHPGRRAADALDEGANTKLDELQTILEEAVIAGNRKAIVFAESRDLTSAVCEMLEAMEVSHVHFHGAIPLDERPEKVQAFTTEASCKVFVSTDLGSVGLNLQVADLIINLDQPWSAARRNQRLGRVYRIGRREPVQLVTLAAEETIEEGLPFVQGVDRGLLSRLTEGDTTRGPIDLGFEVKGRTLREAIAELLIAAPPRLPRRSEDPATPPPAEPGAAPLTDIRLKPRAGETPSLFDAPREATAPAEAPPDLDEELDGGLAARLRSALGPAFLGLQGEGEARFLLLGDPNLLDEARELARPAGLTVLSPEPPPRPVEAPDPRDVATAREAEARVELAIARQLHRSGFPAEALRRAARAAATLLDPQPGAADLGASLIAALRGGSLSADAAAELSLLAFLAEREVAPDGLTERAFQAAEALLGEPVSVSEGP